MVVIVPAFTIGQQSHPPAICRQVLNREISVAKSVTGGIHQPSAVIAQDQPDAHTPYEKRRPSQKIKQYSLHDGRDDPETAQKLIERHADQIGCITPLQFLCGVSRGYPGDPEHVTPPEALPGTVGVARLVGILMMLAMLRNP